MRAALAWGLALVLLVSACQTRAENPTTTSTTASTSTTVVESTTTVRQTTTTSATSTTVQSTTSCVALDETNYPEDPATVDDLPDPLPTCIEAALPDPDLSITGPEDLDRWMVGWLDWLAWLHAHPAEGAEQLQVNMIPGSDLYEEIRSALIDRAEAGQRLLGGGFVPVSLSGTFDEFFEDKTALRIVMVAEGPPSYLVSESGEVVSVFEGLEGEVTVSALLRYDGERDEWVMETFEVLGPA